MDGETWLRVRIGEVRWQVNAVWLARLFPHDAPIWQTSGEFVKQAKHRWVKRIRDPQGSFFVKCYCTTRHADLVRHCLRSSPAKREWQNLLRLQACGIPSPPPLALGERVVHGIVRENYLVTEEIPNSQPLDEYLLGNEHDPQQRMWLQQPLAELLARCHASGVDHRDFHAGNVLVQFPEASCQGGVFLIDVPNVRWKRSLNANESVKSLAMFFSGVVDLTTAAEQRACFQVYSKLRAAADFPPRRETVVAIHQETARHTTRVLQKQDRRCFRASERFRIRNFPKANTVAMTELPDSTLDDWYQQALTNSSARSDRMEWYSQKRNARQVWQQSQALLLRRVPVRRPLALFEFSSKRLVIVWEQIPNELGWHAVLQFPPTILAEALGTLLGRLHRWGMLHGRVSSEAIGWRQTSTKLSAFWTKTSSSSTLAQSNEQRFRDEVRQMIELLPFDSHPETLCRSYLKARGKLPQLWKECC